MNIKGILKDIESSQWWTEECPGHLGLCMEFMDGFAGIRNQIDLPVHSLSVLLLENGKVREETKADEKTEIFQFILSKTEKDTEFVDNLIKKQRILKKKLYIACKKAEKHDQKKVSDKELWSLYKGLMDSWITYCEMAVIPESGDTFAEQYLIPMLREKEKIKEEEIHEMVIIFSTPIMYSFMDNEHIDFLKLCISCIDDKKGVFEKRLRVHSEMYHWLRNNYSQPYHLDMEYFRKRAKEEIKGKTKADIENEIERIKKEKEDFRKKKEEFRRRYRLGKDTMLIFSIYEKMAGWIDERKHTMLTTIYHAGNILTEIAERNRLGWKEVMYYTIPEIKALLLDDKRLSKDELKSRLGCSAYISTYDEKSIVIGEDAKRIADAFNRKIKMEIVKGIVANKAKGKVVGEVCVVIDPHKDKFPEGKILVTTMTRPDFVHLIKKAKAIITDEGGITSHAAVVSREFGIPCIIGTKNGTRMLRTGDKVEIDTDKGIVRKI